MRADDGSDDLTDDLGVRPLFEDEIAQLVAVFLAVRVHDIDGDALVGEFFDDLIRKRGDGLLPAVELADDGEPARLVEGEHGFEPQERACDRRYS